jgi:hypothetical protein
LKPTQFDKHNSPETLTKEAKPILRTYTTDHEQVKKEKSIERDLTKRHAEPSPTRHRQKDSPEKRQHRQQ